LDILNKQWSPAWGIQSACLAIVAILCEPAHDSPLNCDAGNMLRAKDFRAYKSMVELYGLEPEGSKVKYNCKRENGNQTD
jgi:peroxin-4